MSYAFQGTVWIPNQEFWEFVEERRIIPDELFGTLSVRYDKEDFAIIINSNKSDKDFYIDGMDFWKFVHEYFPCVGAETRFSDPVFEVHDIRIECVMGSESPEGWSDSHKPDWMKKGK